MTGRTRRGVKTTALVTAAMAALTASQGPGAAVTAGQQRSAPDTAGDGAYRTELPPLRTPEPVAGPVAADPAAPTAGSLPATVFAAYRAAETELARSVPGCGLRWQLLAAIGQVESGQARGGRVTADGATLSPILGPRLDGDGFALIRDSDGGRYDGDTEYDRAVGPMQFIPSTWAYWGADGNGDGRHDPQNVFDAALAAGRYLCAGGRNLSDPSDLERSVLSYNHSTAYLRTVLAWYTYYLSGHRVVPDAGGAVAESAGAPERRGTPEQRTPRTPTPSPTAAPTTPRPSAPAPGAPSPSPTKSAPAGDPEPAEPLLPLPTPRLELPGDTVLPGTGETTSNGTDSMSAAPSTIPDTGR
ncbi:lytic transglycosylase domain-containing protein [Streptomyces peucetius]|uniref:Lytic murein transglycosylase n=1 Tax=Streptomyces peucetius TaxID=1950 RepID=A0ABY6IE54_STRPE|nr:lytic murein transglycosylase [Streptomyces peucetius]UYQ65296.1 lytic murein transglycosylase [Streptomyces peucetius]